MTTLTTPREIRSPQNGRVPRLDSPAMPAGAGARVPVTVRAHKIRDQARVGFKRWWLWTARPVSLRTTWALSAVDAKRIPAKSSVLRQLWSVSNHTDRLVMFVLILAAPTFAQGPLRHLAVRPTRRWALYLTTAALVVAHLIGKKV